MPSLMFSRSAKSVFGRGVIIALLVLLGACQKEPQPAFIATHTSGEHPTEIIQANGEYWLAQLKEDTLYRVPNFPEDLLAHRVEPTSKTNSVNSPHFMAADQSGVYVSEGRGGAVRYFSFDGSVKGDAVPIDVPLQRPHGLCIKDGWLYIADSVGSRLVRWHLREHRSEVFADLDKKIAYGRQLLCREDGIWLSNSYEKAFQLNDGVGSNILRISDFTSGESETIVAFPDTNTTGIGILDDKLLLVGRWVLKRDVVMLDLETGQMAGTLFTSDAELDTPYGITVDESARRFYITFLGINPYKTGDGKGAILEWRY